VLVLMLMLLVQLQMQEPLKVLLKPVWLLLAC
jgi:hypothetical protein